MLVCDKHRTGKPRVARYELSLKDLMAESEKPHETRSAFKYAQEYGKHDIFPLKKDLCAECGEKVAAIINAFIEGLEREDLIEQIEEILSKKTKEMEKQKEVRVGR